MTKRIVSKIPFVGLHAHSGLSVFDGLGMPSEHMDFAYENGLDAHALTDHGHMNGLSFQVEHAKKMLADGRKLKPIFGCEAYFIKSHKKWRQMYEEHKANSKRQKKEDYGMVIEDENASKSKRHNPLNTRRHLVTVAQNHTGLNNLFKLISDSYRPENFYRYPRIDFEMLDKYNEGLIVTSACLGGPLAGDFWQHRESGHQAVLAAMKDTIAQFKEIFGDRFYGEIQWNNIEEQHLVNDFIIQACIEMGVEVVSTADSHYPRPDLWKDREMYKRIGWAGKAPAWEENANLLPESVDDIGYELYPKNGDQMWESYLKYSKQSKIEYSDSYVRDSIERTHHIAFDRIEDFLPSTEVRLPEFVIPEGTTAIQALTKDALAGLKDKELTDQVYVDRLKYELSVIKDRGFAQYFLTMKAISDKAQEDMLVGLGRGSAAGSLLSYVLDITQVDPIKYGLQFERFLTKGGAGYPDIDFDVEEPMELKERLASEWGETTVVPISNFNTLQLRSLIKDIGKFYGVPFTEVNKVTSVMMAEATPKAKAAHGQTAGVYTPTFDEVKEYSETLQAFFEKYPAIATHVDNLFGNVRSVSRHAGGVVVAENLDRHMPLINSGGVMQTPWSEGQNVRHLEPLGFIKFDLLGLSTLRMISGAIRHILKRHHGIEEPTFKQVREFYDKHLHPNVIDFDDQAVWKNIFHEGKWAGIFQMTSGPAQSFCQEAKPESLMDFAAITAIFRPGPLSAKADKMYIANKGNPTQVTYDHPLIEEVLGDTYGLLVFQEQLAMLAHKLGDDFSLDEGNLLRKVLTKKGTGKDKVKDNLYNKFLKGCKDKGLAEEKAKDLWSKMEYFSGYGFNLSHAVSYGAVSFQCAWLAHYYSTEWMAAFLDKEPEKRKMAAINTAKSFGFEIVPASVNKSGMVWEISEDGQKLIQPLTAIKGLGVAAIQQVLDNRPFNTIEEFLFNENITYSKLNKKALDVLVRSKALDELMDDRFTGPKHFWSAVAVDRPRKEKNLIENIESYADEGHFSTEETIDHLTTLTGIYPIDLVMDNFTRDSLMNKGCPPISEYDPELVFCWFIPREVKVKKTKNGKKYFIVSVTDHNGADENIKCWGVKDTDIIRLNRVYVGKLKHEARWGFSTFSIQHNLRLLRG